MIKKQRRGGDSNPRYPCGHTGFRNQTEPTVIDAGYTASIPGAADLAFCLALLGAKSEESAAAVVAWPTLPLQVRAGILTQTVSDLLDSIRAALPPAEI